MSSLEKIQRISQVLRYVLLLGAAGLLLLVVLGLTGQVQGMVILGDGLFTELWASGTVSRVLLIGLAAPMIIMLLTGIYWLQRLFGEYHQGHFFTDATMRCYLWLVWLKAGVFAYGLIWPQLVISLSSVATDVAEVNVEVGTLVEIIVLLIIVHLLRQAQHLSDENKAFI